MRAQGCWVLAFSNIWIVGSLRIEYSIANVVSTTLFLPKRTTLCKKLVFFWKSSKLTFVSVIIHSYGRKVLGVKQTRSYSGFYHSLHDIQNLLFEVFFCNEAGDSLIEHLTKILCTFIQWKLWNWRALFAKTMTCCWVHSIWRETSFAELSSTQTYLDILRLLSCCSSNYDIQQ